MGAIKFYLLAFVVIASVQLQTEALTLGFRSQNVIAGGLQHAVDHVRQTAPKNHHKNVKKLEFAFTEFRQFSEKEIGLVNTEIRDFASEIFRNIRELRYKTSDKDVSACIKEQEGRIKEVLKKIGEGVRECAAEIIAELTRIFHETVEDFNRINEELLVLIAELEGCGSPACVVDGSMKILEKSFEINRLMGDKITEVMYVIKKNQDEVRYCIRASVDSVKEEIKAIADDIKSCKQQ